MIGQVVGNYKIIRALGEGGVGMVYQGVDTMLDREVAIKVLRPELASQTSVVERFRSEAVTLARLSHPNIATLYSLFRHGDHLFMVLEFIRGETLDQMLYRRGKLPVDEAIPIFCQSLEGIDYAHQRGIVHRDIKPGNLMLAEDGVLKVLDFGIARLLGSSRMTRVGNVIGTLEYMSPEQVRGHETDARSDVYGLGIMLYEILTGKLPFESENDFELMKMQTEQTPPPPRTINPEIPEEIEAAIMKAVAKDPGERFQSAGDFLETFLELGFALPNTTFGFGTIGNIKKFSRPSNPGLPSGEPRRKSSGDAAAQIPQSLISTESMTLAGPETSTTPESHLLTSESETPVVQDKGGEIKGTRLAAPILAPANEMKATRLGTMSEVRVSAPDEEGQPSFLARLTWTHYAGASAILLVFFALAGMAIVLPAMFGEDKKAAEQPKKVEQPKPVETPKVETAASPTPEVVTQPTVSQPRPQTEPTQIPVSNNPVVAENPPPADQPGQNEPPAQKQPKQRVTVRNDRPPANTKQPSPGPKPQKTPNLANILIGH